ncbi:DUF2946 family protein [Burkholderia sp. AU6039]|uniref:DUF2946 family protein n=1 Tax=Burkholderia sp. AU6039 TaxID=2015344 RepID=UPI00211B67D5|nr:DUF2946 family protein [Burkholderia sp. AU6039]
MPVMFRPCRRHRGGDKLRPSCPRSAPSRRCAGPSGRCLRDFASMSYWRKFLVVVLLALSLPIQSFAAVSMACAGAVVAMPHAGDGASTDDAVAPRAMPSAHGGQHEDEHAHGDHARHAQPCSACGSCCLGAGMADLPAMSVASGIGIARVSFAPTPVVVSFLTGGIDRPPRGHLV